MTRYCRPLAWLPNCHGYRFIGIKRNGDEIECVVECGEDGLHRIAGGVFDQFIGWRPIR